MEKLNLAYSTKNILILQLIKKIHLFIRKTQWKAIFYDMKVNSNNNNNLKDNSKSKNGVGRQKEVSSKYGVRTNKFPPQVKQIKFQTCIN